MVSQQLREAQPGTAADGPEERAYAPQGRTLLSSVHNRPWAQKGRENRGRPGKAIWAEGGQSVELKIPGGPGGAGGVRGKVTGFSRKSRNRLLHEVVNRIDQRAMPVEYCRFITLTYPGEAPDPRTAKAHLKAIWKRYERQFGPRGGIWKMEPQQRGAPHFHLLVFVGRGDLQAEIRWWAVNWSEVVNSGDRKHLLWHLGKLGHGNKPCVEVVRSWNGVSHYAGKYLGKIVAADESWQWPGRYWGVWRRHLLPIKLLVEDMEPEATRLLRRGMRRYFEHQMTGRYRIEQENGKIYRGFMNRSQLAKLDDFAGSFTIRPYHRRWPSSCGGIRLFMPWAEFVRWKEWVKREVASSAMISNASIVSATIVNAITGEMIEAAGNSPPVVGAPFSPPDGGFGRG